MVGGGARRKIYVCRTALPFVLSQQTSGFTNKYNQFADRAAMTMTAMKLFTEEVIHTRRALPSRFLKVNNAPSEYVLQLTFTKGLKKNILTFNTVVTKYTL